MRAVFSILLLVWVIFSAKAQDTLPKHFNYWAKPFEKAEKAYSKEDYKTAEEQISSIAKTIGKLNDKSMEAWHYANEAKYKDGVGKFGEMNEKIAQAIGILEKQTEKNPQTALAWLAVSKTYTEYGDIQKALKYAEKAKEIAESQKSDTTVRLWIECHRAEVLWQFGSIKESLELIEKISVTVKNRSAVKEVSYVYVKKGKVRTKIRKLKGYELQLYQELYPKLMLSKARALAKKGEIELADAAFNQTIELSDSKTLIVTNVRTKAYQALLKEPNTEPDDNISILRKIKSDVKKNLNLTGKLSFTVHQALVKNYYVDSREKKAEDVADDLKDEVKKRSTFYRNWADEIFNEENFAKIEGENEDELKKRDIKRAEDKLLDLYGKNIPSKLLKKLPTTDLLQYFTDNSILETMALLDDGKYAVPANHPRGIRIFGRLYDDAINRSDFAKAESYLQQVMLLTKLLYGEDSPEWDFVKLKLADYQTNVTEDYKNAEAIFDKSLPIAKIQLAPQNPAFLEAQTSLAKLYDNTDRYRKALEILQDQIKILSRKGEKDNYGLASVLSAMAAVQIRAGDYKEAETNVEKSISIFKNRKAGRRLIDYARALQTKARLYTIYGFYKEAEDLLDDSQDKSIIKRNASVEVRSLDDIALLKIKQEQYSEVEKPLTQSIEATEIRYGKVHRNLISPLNYQAILYLDKGNYVAAEKDIRRSSEIATQLFGADSDRNSDCLLTLGQVQANLGDSEKAEQSFRKVIQIININRGENHILSVKPLIELAKIRFARNKNLKEAEQTFAQAREIVSKELGKDNPLYAEVQKELAGVYIEADKLDQALPLLNEANAIWIKKVGKTNKNTADVLVKKGDIYSKKKDFKNAELSYDNAKSMYESLFNKDYPAYQKVIGRLGRMYYIKGDAKRALENLEISTKGYLRNLKSVFPSRSEGEKAKYWNSIKGDFEFFNTLAVKLQATNPELIEKMYNFQLATKALLLSSSVKVREKILSSPDTLLKAKYKEWITKKEYLNTVLALNTEQMKELKINTEDIENEIDKLEQDLSQRSGAFSDAYNSKSYTWSNVKNKLKDNEAAVEIIRFRYFGTSFSDSILYAALIVTPQTRKQPDLIVLKNGNELETKFLNFYRNAVKNRRDDNISYRQFWEPLEKSLKATKIYFSPDGVYNQLNPDAIRLPDGSFVIDKYDIVLVSNTKDLLAKEEKKPVNTKNTFVFIGNPAFCSPKDSVECSVSSLPGSETEVQELVTLTKSKGYPVTSSVENEAGTDEENTKKLRNIRVYHVATHGFFLADNRSSDELAGDDESSKASKNPLFRSGLLLRGGGDVLASKQPGLIATENGILTAYEAMNLGFDDVELVVLSACETGLGEVQVGEGVFGLQRAFIVAGADAVVMSLFKVNDEVTQKLMVKFYSKWFTSGNKRQAFLQARKEIKDEYKSPIFWGAFQMIGLE